MIDVLIDGPVELVNDPLVRLLGILLKALSHAQLSLQLRNLLPVLRLVLDVALRAPLDLALHLLVLLLHGLNLLFQVEVFVVPGHLLDLVFVLLLSSGVFVEALWHGILLPVKVCLPAD